MSNNSNISPGWAGFRRLWIIVAIILFFILAIMAILGFGPWSNKCDVKPTIVEKVVEKEKLVDNPDLLARIGVLEKENELIAVLKQENEKIAGLKANIADLTKSKSLIAGLQAKVNALEAVDLDFESPKLLEKISLLQQENASIGNMKRRILELEASNAKTNDDQNEVLIKQIAELKAENGLIAGLKAKVKALEAVDVNFIKPQDNSKLIQKINGLEVDNLKIPVLQDRIKTLQTENSLIAGLKAKVSALEAVDVNFIKPQDNTKLLQKINGLEVDVLKIPVLQDRVKALQTENSLIGGLQAKVKALEAVDVNFIKPADDSKLLERISDLEKENGLISGLQAKVKALEAIDVNFIKPADDSKLLERISDLEKENGLIPGLQAKVKALEAIDINFITNNVSATVMPKPDVAKLFFKPGSSRFPIDVKQSMADVIVYLRANPSANVSLTGFHDDTGNASWNQRLANKRSNRVKKILLDAGIANERINVAIPSQTLGTGSPAEARRVEVKVL